MTFAPERRVRALSGKLNVLGKELLPLEFLVEKHTLRNERTSHQRGCNLSSTEANGVNTFFQYRGPSAVAGLIFAQLTQGLSSKQKSQLLCEKVASGKSLLIHWIDAIGRVQNKFQDKWLDACLSLLDTLAQEDLALVLKDSDANGNTIFMSMMSPRCMRVAEKLLKLTKKLTLEEQESLWMQSNCDGKSTLSVATQYQWDKLYNDGKFSSQLLSQYTAMEIKLSFSKMRADVGTLGLVSGQVDVLSFDDFLDVMRSIPEGVESLDFSSVDFSSYPFDELAASLLASNKVIHLSEEGECHARLRAYLTEAAVATIECIRKDEPTDTDSPISLFFKNAPAELLQQIYKCLPFDSECMSISRR